VTKGCAALVWTPDAVRVLTGSGEFKLGLVIDRRDRFGLRLWSDHAGQLYLRVIDERQPLWISADKGATFQAVPPIPVEDKPVSAYNYKLHSASGIISALGHHVVWIYDAVGGQWKSRELPSDMHVKDISIDGQQGFWFAGSVDSRRIPGEKTEAAMRYQAASGTAFQPRSPHLSYVDAVKVIKDGGLTELRTVEAEAEPVVATSLCSWLLDDSSSFIFTFDSKRTFVSRLKAELISHIDRSSNSLRLFTYQGSAWERNGNRWERRHSLVAPIERSLKVSGRKILIRGLDVRREKIAAAVEVSPPGATDVAQDPELTAICLSVDNGISFEVTHQLVSKSSAEIHDVVWLGGRP
jgi:hypothetical protein